MISNRLWCVACSLKEMFLIAKTSQPSLPAKFVVLDVAFKIFLSLAIFPKFLRVVESRPCICHYASLVVR